MKVVLFLILCLVASSSRASTSKKDDECKKTPDNELQIFPRCTAEEAVAKELECAEIMFAGFPYADQASCERKLDEAVACLASAAAICLEGDCPTVLDDYPFAHIRDLFKSISEEAPRVKTLRQLLKAWGKEDDFADGAYRDLCPVDSKSFDLLKFVKKTAISAAPTCQNSNVLKEAIVSMLTEFHVVETHPKFCKDLSEFRTKLVKFFKKDCSALSLHSALVFHFHNYLKTNGVPDGGASPIQPIINFANAMVKVYKVVEKNVEEAELPGCKEY